MKKIIAIVTAFVAMIMVTGKAEAGVLENASVLVGSPGTESNSVYTFEFDHATTGDITKIDFLFCQHASGACTRTNTDADGALLTSVTGLTNGGTWVMSTRTDNHIVIDDNAVGTSTIGDGDTITVVMADISNGSITGGAGAGDQNCGGLAQPSNSSTCFVRIVTYDGLTPLDETVVSYTRVSSVTVTAKVDPTFTFLVTGVDSNVVVNSITTSVDSAFNTLPFGNLTVGTVKYASHELHVETNTTSGYTVSVVLSNPIVGVYTDNNIDPFVGANGLATNIAPQTWASPTGGTANDNTGWFGYNTTDAGVPNGAAFSAGGPKFAGLAGTARDIMDSDTSDDGSVPVYVTYALEANVFQPSDNYTGTVVYNALPTY